MSFLYAITFRWWAFRQFLHELYVSTCWGDVEMALEDELWHSVMLGHVNLSDICMLEEDFPELFRPTFVSMHRLMEVIDGRIDEAKEGGLVRWGSYPQYLELQRLHLRECVGCRERIFADTQESIRHRVELDPILKLLRRKDDEKR